MRAVRGVPPGVAVVDVDEPEGAGELIRVKAVGICASDLNYLARGSDQILGHEIAGVTTDGRAVAVSGVVGCGACEWCEQGRDNLCRMCGTNILGLTVAGGMSEYFRVPPRAVIPLPAGLTPEDASVAEPGAVAWHACRKGGVGPGVRVAVVGAGAIGLLALLAAIEMGAPEVGLVAKYDYQAELGEQFGAARPSGLYDVVVETSGSASGLAHAIELARPMGVVATVSVYPPDVAWPFRAAFLKEVAVVPSIGYGHDGCRHEIGEVAAMLAGRPDVADALITHRFGIEDAARAFEVAAGDRAQGKYFRAVVHP